MIAFGMLLNVDKMQSYIYNMIKSFSRRRKFGMNEIEINEPHRWLGTSIFFSDMNEKYQSKVKANLNENCGESRSFFF